MVITTGQNLLAQTNSLLKMHGSSAVVSDSGQLKTVLGENSLKLLQDSGVAYKYIYSTTTSVEGEEGFSDYVKSKF